MTIDAAAFSRCRNLTSVSILEGVVSVGDLAFDSCGGLTRITIPESVASIGIHAFFQCTSLRDVYFKGDPPEDVGFSLFTFSDNATVRFLPEATGWGTRFGDLPTALWLPEVRMDDGAFG